MAGYHVAFLPFPAFGHINSALPVVAELVRRGHRVTFATNERLAPLATAAGATVLRYESWLASRSLPDRIDGEYLVHEPVRSIDEGIATVPIYLAGFGGDVPDVLCYDVSTFAAGRVLSRVWNRPAIELFATFASNERYTLTGEIGAMYADQIDKNHPALVDFFVKQGQLLHDNGLFDVTLEEFNAPCDEANIVFLPRSFQPAADTFDSRFAFVGACLSGRSEPDWTPPDTDLPLVYVSMGSLAYDHRYAFLRTCLDAFTGQPYHVLVSTGPIDPAELGAVPPNIELQGWAPQLAVLERADVFVSHAGMNSVMEAMYFGTPVVAVPHMPEQRLVAGRLAEMHLGAHLPADEFTADSLRAAVASVVASRTIRAAVDALRSELRAAGGPAAAADYVESRAAHGRSDR